MNKLFLKKTIIYFGIILFIFLIDRISKLYILSILEDSGFVDININKHNLAASLQKTISDCLLDRTKLAIKIYKQITKSYKVNLVIAGGVAANKKIRADLKNLSNKEDIMFAFDVAL